VSLIISAARAPLGTLAADCACGGEGWRGSLHRERLAWHAERARLESELAMLREKLLSEGPRVHTRHLGDQGSPITRRRLVAPHPPHPGRGRALRSVLQVDPECSITELLYTLLRVAVQADPVAAVTAMFATNVACAMCLLPCGAAPAADVLDCAMGCLKQEEGTCCRHFNAPRRKLPRSWPGGAQPQRASA
jgi:hypothetical protein